MTWDGRQISRRAFETQVLEHARMPRQQGQELPQLDAKEQTYIPMYRLFRLIRSLKGNACFSSHINAYLAPNLAAFISRRDPTRPVPSHLVSSRLIACSRGYAGQGDKSQLPVSRWFLVIAS
jgi:hypothetical protein